MAVDVVHYVHDLVIDLVRGVGPLRLDEGVAGEGAEQFFVCGIVGESWQ